MHVPKFFAYYNSVASVQSSISSIMKNPSSWKISWMAIMLTINSLRQGSIAGTGQKYQYKLSKIISSPEFASTSWSSTQPMGQNFTKSNTYPKPSLPVPHQPTTVSPCPNSRIVQLWQDSTCSTRNQIPNPQMCQSQRIFFFPLHSRLLRWTLS